MIPLCTCREAAESWSRSPEGIFSSWVIQGSSGCRWAQPVHQHPWQGSKLEKAVTQTSPTPLSLQSGRPLADPQFSAMFLFSCGGFQVHQAHQDTVRVTLSQPGGIFSLEALLSQLSLHPSLLFCGGLEAFQSFCKSPRVYRPGMAPLACAWGTCGTDLLWESPVMGVNQLLPSSAALQGCASMEWGEAKGPNSPLYKKNLCNNSNPT